MKKFLLLLSLVCIRQVNAQTWVTIPDANFVTCLQNYVPAAMHGDSLNTSSTLVTTTTYSITVSSRSIANLFGIQYFTSLTYLNCSYNSLTNLPALPNTLIYLDCGTNSITNLPALPNTLTNLLCNWNALTSLPALPNTLTYLDCYVNSITNLPALPNTLTELNCSNNTLTSLPTLPNALNYLSCHHNSIPCFRPFSNSMMGLDIDPNPYYCLPNYISCMNTTDLAMPLCLAGNSNGCTVTGIEQLTFNVQVTIYPNPISDHFIIETNSTDKLTVDLYDLNGRHVFSKNASDKTNIDVTNLNEGVYTLTIKTVDRIINKKLVIVR